MSKANYDFTAGTAAASCHVLPHPGTYASDVCIVRVVHQPGMKGASDTPSIQVPNWKGKKKHKNRFNIHSGGFLCPFPLRAEKSSCDPPAF